MRKNENRSGYKKTKLGWIPDEWDMAPLSDIVNPDKPIVYGIVQAGPHVPDGIPYIRSTDVGATSVPVVCLLRTSPQIAAKYARAAVSVGDVVFSLRGNIGETSIVPAALSGANLTQGTARISLDRSAISLFVHCTFASNPMKRLVNAWAKGSTFREITIEDLRKLPVPLPALSEQKAIAEVLECWDKAIRGYEKKIEKKRNIKKGLMQGLLSGKQRLPGFDGKWKEVRLKNLLSYERPDKYIVQDTNYIDYDGTPVLTANKSFILGYTDETFGVCNNIPVIIFDDFTINSKFVDFPFKVKSSAIKLLRPLTNEVDIRFVFELIQLSHFAVGEHKRYYISEYQHIRLTVPDYREQQAISSVLSAADAEIVTLEKKLESLREQKRFLLNNLVTGTIRLPQFVSRSKPARTDGDSK